VLRPFALTGGLDRITLAIGRPELLPDDIKNLDRVPIPNFVQRRVGGGSFHQ
jgi:hypothetical protein